MPRAPAGLTANGLKLDSTSSWAASRSTGTFHLVAARVSASRHRGGTNDGGGCPASAPSSDGGAVRSPADTSPKCHGSHAYRLTNPKRLAFFSSHPYADAGP